MFQRISNYIFELLDIGNNKSESCNKKPIRHNPRIRREELPRKRMADLYDCRSNSFLAKRNAKLQTKSFGKCSRMSLNLQDGTQRKTEKKLNWAIVLDISKAFDKA